MKNLRLILCLTVAIGAVLVSSNVSAAESCRACEGLESGGSSAYYRLEISSDQAYAPGKVTFYEKKNDRCCLKNTAVAYPSSRVVMLNKAENTLYLSGLDGKREGGFTRGILRYDLVAGTIEPVATRIHGEKRCKGGDVFALIHALAPTPNGTKRKSNSGAERLGLSVLKLGGGYGAQLTAVAEGKHLRQEARLMRMTFSKDCKTLSYSAAKRGVKLSFAVPDEPVATKSKDATEITVAILGNIISCPTVEQGSLPKFPVAISFSVKDVSPVGDIGTEGVEKLSYKVGKKAFEKFNMVYLRPDTPVQVVITGNDQLALGKFTVVSVQHR